MKTWEIRAIGGIDSLTPVDRPEPKAGPGQAVVRVRASSLNYRDLGTVRDPASRGVTPPLVPNSDGAGEVLSVGAGVTRVKPGDRVAGCFFQRWTDGTMTPEASRSALGGDLPGMLAEQVVLAADGLVHVPAHLSFEEAATLPCAALTAWRAVVEEGGGIKAGQQLLVVGTGGVAIFALQFARLHGAEVTVVSSSDDKLARAKVLGATAGINYKKLPEWGKLVASEGGVDRVVETGGAGTLRQSADAVRMGGWIVLMGNLANAAGATLPAPMIGKMITLKGIRVGSRVMFEAMNRAVAANLLHPVVDRVFDFEQAPDAFRAMESARHFGKLVIRV